MTIDKIGQRILIKKLTVLFLFFSSIFPSALAKYSFVFYSYENPPLAAKRMVKFAQKASPFNEYGIEYIVKVVSNEKEFGCYNRNPNSDHGYSCSFIKLARKVQREGHDNGAIVHPKLWGRAKLNAIGMFLGTDHITGTPYVFIHELMHNLGFHDEYSYGSNDYRCSGRDRSFGFNLTRITPRNSYESDSKAKELYKKHIRWFPLIGTETPITHFQNSANFLLLGTSALSSKHYYGLFSSEIICPQKTSTKRKIWLPTENQTTIMGRGVHRGADPSYYTDLIKMAFEDRGIKKKTFDFFDRPDWENCHIGFSSGWELIAKSKKIFLEGVTPRKICHFVQNQSGANFHFKFFKNKQMVHQTKIVWGNISIVEKFERNSPPVGIAEEADSYNIINIPLPIASVDSYQVWDLVSEKMVGKGKLEQSRKI